MLVSVAKSTGKYRKLAQKEKARYSNLQVKIRAKKNKLLLMRSNEVTRKAKSYKVLQKRNELKQKVAETKKAASHQARKVAIKAKIAQVQRQRANPTTPAIKRAE